MKARLGLTILVLALAACQSRRVSVPMDGDSDSTVGNLDVTNGVNSCFKTATPTISVTAPTGSIAQGATVTFAVSIPNCTYQLKLTRADGGSLTFSKNAYYEKAFSSIGEVTESVRIEHVNPVASGVKYVDISVKVNIVASGSSVGTLACEVTPYPSATVPIPVGPNLVPLAPANMLFVVTSSKPMIITDIGIAPDPSKVQYLPPSAPTPATQQFVEMRIANPFFNRVGFRVKSSATPAEVGECSTIVNLQPVTVAPPPTIIVKVGESEGNVNVGTVDHTLVWSATNATACSVYRNGINQDWNTISGSKLVQATSSPATYAVNCTGPGGNASRTLVLTLSCNPATNILRTLEDKRTTARDIPRRLCVDGDCSGYPADVEQTPNSNQVVVKTSPLISNLVAGQHIRLSDISGYLVARVDGGKAVTYSRCDTGENNNGGQSPFRLQFTDDSGNLIAVPSASTPSGLSYSRSSGAMVPSTEFTAAAGVIVPAGATKVWDSYPDSAYFDNEGNRSISNPNPVPATGGCRYVAKVYGCQ